MKVVITLLFAVLLSGCSSIISKNSYSVAITSTPSEASFEIYNASGEKIHRGITPQSVVLNSSYGYFKGEQYTIELEKEGYKNKTHFINSSLDGWYFGNLLFGGLVGMLIVDPLTGSMYNLPYAANIPLRKIESE